MKAGEGKTAKVILALKGRGENGHFIPSISVSLFEIAGTDLTPKTTPPAPTHTQAAHRLQGFNFMRTLDGHGAEEVDLGVIQRLESQGKFTHQLTLPSAERGTIRPVTPPLAFKIEVVANFHVQPVY
jgi:hypothetical protein